MERANCGPTFPPVILYGTGFTLYFKLIKLPQCVIVSASLSSDGGSRLTANILSGDSVTPLFVSPVGEYPPPTPKVILKGLSVVA